MKYELDWTLESGPDEAPSSIDIAVVYNYYPGADPSWTSYGDGPEIEIETASYEMHGEIFTLTIISPEDEKICTYISENPPDDDYYDD